MTFHSEIWLYAGAASLAAAAALLWWSARRSKAKLALFASPKLLPMLTSSVSKMKVSLKNILICLGMASLFIALARPQYGYKWEEVKAKGVDVVFALDTSKSMLAEDVKPNRLERAKLSILDAISKFGQDRIGLVAFSGQAFLQCPITLDYDAFRMSLEAVDTNIIQRGGTNISSAIDEAESAFADTVNHKIIILISDGEDLEADAISKAKEAAGKGATLFCLGVGSASGEPVPVRDELGRLAYVKDSSGKVITSRLNEDTLKKIAEASGGFYANLLPDGMEKICEEGVKKIPQMDLSAKMRHQAIERFQIPLLAAFLLLAFETLVGTRKFFPHRARLKASRGAFLSVILLCAIILPNHLRAQEKAEEAPPADESSSAAVQGAKPEPKDARGLFNAAVENLESGKLEDAKTKNIEAVKMSKDLNLHSKAYFNNAVADYRQAKLSAEKLAGIGEFKKNSQEVLSLTNHCISGGMEILKNAAPMLKKEAADKKANPNAKSGIDAPQFQETLKQAISQCESVQKSAEETEKKRAELDKALAEVKASLENSRKSFENSLELNNASNASQNLNNVRKAEENADAEVKSNSEISENMENAQRNLKKVVEELKKLLREKQDDNKDNQNNQDNKENKDDQQNKDQQQNQDKNQDGQNDKQQNSQKPEDKNPEKKDADKDNSKDEKAQDKKENGQDQEKKDNEKNANDRDSQKGEKSRQEEQKQESGKDEQAVNNRKEEQKKAEEQASDGGEKKQTEEEKRKAQELPAQGAEEKKGEQAAVPQESAKPEEADENFRRAAGVMTRKEASQMLDSLKGEEKRMPYKGYGEQQKRYEDKNYKDW